MITPSDLSTPSAASLVDARYLEAAADSLNAHSKLLRSLISQKRLPENKIPVPVIEALMQQFALMDSNNFPNHAGAGEREGRVFSSIVSRRHFNMSHGIGRSGDLLADQPKAAGSSLMSKLCNCFVKDALNLVGLNQVEKAIVVPSCTGMTLSLVLQYVRSVRVMNMNSSNQPSDRQPKIVIWPRIDQKTCLKCIYTTGLEPHVVELRRTSPTTTTTRTTTNKSKSEKNETQENNHEPELEHEQHDLLLRVHPEDVAAAIESVGKENIVCVLSTTSCFAPRLPDDPLQLARVCEKYQLPLVVNNAYGIQSPYINKRLNAAFQECGKKIMIASVQSCDKNFLVPVGGAVLASNSAEFVDKVAALYAGRASADPSTDMFLTLLEMGRSTWMQVQQHRVKTMWPIFTSRVKEFARARGEILIMDEKVNDISFAVTLRNFEKMTGKTPTWLGGALFRSGISGPRILNPPSKAPSNNKNDDNCDKSEERNDDDDQQKQKSPQETKTTTTTGKDVVKKQTTTTTTTIGTSKFTNYGMHGLDHTSPPMIVMACAIGMTEEVDVEITMKRLEALYPLASSAAGSTSSKKK